MTTKISTDNIQASTLTLLSGSGGSAALEILTPVVASPTQSEIDVSRTVTIVGGAYAALYSSNQRSFRLFEIDLASGDFSTPVVSVEANTDSFTVGDLLAPETNFKVRIKDQSVNGAASEFSTVVAFTTANISVNTPTITVEGSPDQVPKAPTLTTSAFTTTPADSDTHAATDWQVLSADVVVFESLADATNKLSIVVPSGILTVDTAYTFRARHIGTALGAGTFAQAAAATVALFDIVPLLAVAHDLAPFITIYDQQIDTFVKLADPATPLAGRGLGVAFSNNDEYMAVAHDLAPFITVYKRSGGSGGDVFTKLADPSVTPTGLGLDVAFSSDTTYMAVTHAITPFITVYKRSGDVFTKLANPAILPPSVGRAVAFSSDTTYLAVAHDLAPFIAIYKRSGDVFTKLANPAILPPSTGRAVAFSSDTTYMAVAHDLAPFIAIYKRSGDVFTKLANPSVTPTGAGTGVAFSSDTTYMAVTHAITPFITVYKRSGDTFTKLANPAILPPSTVRAVAFSSDTTYLAVAHDLAPFIAIYKRSGDVFTKLADPSVTPTGTGRGVAFSNTGFPQS